MKISLYTRLRPEIMEALEEEHDKYPITAGETIEALKAESGIVDLKYRDVLLLKALDFAVKPLSFFDYFLSAEEIEETEHPDHRPDHRQYTTFDPQWEIDEDWYSYRKYCNYMQKLYNIDNGVWEFGITDLEEHGFFHNYASDHDNIVWLLEDNFKQHRAILRGGRGIDMWRAFSEMLDDMDRLPENVVPVLYNCDSRNELKYNLVGDFPQ